MFLKKSQPKKKLVPKKPVRKPTVNITQPKKETIKVKKGSTVTTMKLKASDKKNLKKDKDLLSKLNKVKSNENAKKKVTVNSKAKSTKTNRVSKSGKPLASKSSLEASQAEVLNKRVREQRKKTQWLAWKMYSYQIFNALLKGRIDKRDPNLNANAMQIGYSEIFTKKIVSSYLVISYLPSEIHAGFVNDIVGELREQSFWSSLTVKHHNKKYSADFTSSTMISRLSRWQYKIRNTEIEGAEDMGGEQYVFDTQAEIDLHRTNRMIGSYFKLRKNIGRTFESTFILKIDAYNKEDLKLALSLITARLSEYRVNHYQVKSSILDFMRAFSTVSRRKTVSTETTNRLVMTSEDIIKTLPYQQGKVGDKGLWFGSDILSGGNVWLDIMSTPKAKNILVLGESGSGKTFLVSMLLFFHRALKHNIFIHDHKGNEFTEFARAGGGIVVSMTPLKSSYLMTWAIQYEDLETKVEIENAYAQSFAIAEVEFLTLTEPSPDSYKEYKNIFSDFHTFIMSKKEIYKDKIDTYMYSHAITPHFLYSSFLQFMGSPAIMKTYSQKSLTEIQIGLHRFWSPDGARNILYRNPVDITAIKKTKIVCFDFGMAERTKDAVPANEEKLKKIFMNIASSIFINAKKAKGEYSVKVVEEIQSADADILKFTAQDISEGRAKNLINYVLGNASGTLESDSADAKAIVQNMNIRIIGKLAKSAREFFIREYGLESMAEDLKNIAQGKEHYNYAFLLDCKITTPPSTAIVRMVATKEVEMSDFFRTVDYEEHEVRI